MKGLWIAANVLFLVLTVLLAAIGTMGQWLDVPPALMGTLAIAWLLSLPILGIIFAIQVRRRIPEGHCRRCRYNLTGNVSGRCPECGTPIERKTE